MPAAASHVDITKAQAIGGFMSDSELEWLAQQARHHSFIVEFGCLHGRSTRAMADNMPEMGRLWAVDPWSGVYFHDKETKLPIDTYVMPYFVKNLEDHIKALRVIPVRQYSHRFILPHKVDMIFIDGDHRHFQVIKDIKKAYELVRQGGLISGHDYGHPEWPGVKKAVDEMIGPIHLKDSIWYQVKF